ncbi:MAG: Spy/CpxP family protein refolding chaperone [Candidatus Obscuribacterales bacterium]|nr:Spy/CpxP family protein refolding chaperone [Candidatus Obscuribacterales bacterium]
MKKVLASLSLIATISCPVFAQGISDTTFGGSLPDAHFGAVSENDNLAALPGSFTAPLEEDAIGIGGAPGAGAEMNLTDDQLEKIAKLKNAFADASGAKKLQVQSLNRELRSLLTQEKIDRNAVLDIQKKINDLNAELATTKVSMRLDALDVLTTEQRQKMKHKALQRLVFGGGQKRMGIRNGGGMHQGRGMRGHHFKRGAANPGADNAPTADAPSSLPPA